MYPGLFFFAAIPMIISFIMSFSDYSIVKESHFVGLDNYVRLFAGRIPTLQITDCDSHLRSPFRSYIDRICLLIASLLNKSVKGKGLFRTLFICHPSFPL